MTTMKLEVSAEGVRVAVGAVADTEVAPTNNAAGSKTTVMAVARDNNAVGSKTTVMAVARDNNAVG